MLTATICLMVSRQLLWVALKVPICPLLGFAFSSTLWQGSAGSLGFGAVTQLE